MDRGETPSAITLDSTLAEAYASEAFILATRASVAESESAIRRSLKLNPGYPQAHHYYSMLLTMLGRIEAALEENSRILALDPLSLAANANRGVVLMAKGDFAAARNAIAHALALRSDFVLGLYYLGVLDAAEGRYPEALEALLAAEKRAPGFAGLDAAIAFTYTQMGRAREADSVLTQLRTDATDDRSRINLAIAYADLGDLNRAFAIMENARWELTTLIEPRADPLLGSLRRDPRYLQLLTKIGVKP